MGRIQQLSPEVAARIAAGEVVLRPASVAKELIENSVDAGASSIRVEVHGGGVDKLQVSDDGCGMDADDARACIGRHATSKVRSAEDLYRLGTLGFRGEALAAISAAANVTITTRPHEAAEGVRVRVENGVLQECVFCGAAPGTSVAVEQLFMTLPARRKFLKSEAVEYGHVVDVFLAQALATPHIRYELWRDGKRALVLPQTDDPLQRVLDAWGRKITAQEFVSLDESVDGLRLSGHVGRADVQRASNNCIAIFVNGRPVTDKLLMHALMAGYGELMPRGRFPAAALFLEIAPEKVDVNVHPAKAEVRFAEPNAVHQFIQTAVRKTVQTAARTEMMHEVMKVERGDVTSPVILSASEESRFSECATTSTPESLTRFRMTPKVQHDVHHDAPFLPPEIPYRPIGQLDRTYILCEQEGGDLVICDQHAAHERIGFDDLKQQWLAGGVQRQLLLLPQQVQLTQRDYALLSEQMELLAQLGFDIEPFGNATLMVKALPMLLGNIDSTDVLEALAAELAHSGTAQPLEDRIDHILATMACHRQIRGGDGLQLGEQQALLVDIMRRGITHCPHGRPVMVRIGKSEIERRFKRT